MNIPLENIDVILFSALAVLAALFLIWNIANTILAGRVNRKIDILETEVQKRQTAMDHLRKAQKQSVPNQETPPPSRKTAKWETVSKDDETAGPRLGTPATRSAAKFDQSPKAPDDDRPKPSSFVSFGA